MPPAVIQLVVVVWPARDATPAHAAEAPAHIVGRYDRPVGADRVRAHSLRGIDYHGNLSDPRQIISIEGGMKGEEGEGGG